VALWGCGDGGVVGLGCVGAAECGRGCGVGGAWRPKWASCGTEQSECAGWRGCIGSEA